MSLFEVGGLTQGYGGCPCDCHRMPGVVHCVPCCGPGRRNPFEPLGMPKPNPWDITNWPETEPTTPDLTEEDKAALQKIIDDAAQAKNAEIDQIMRLVVEYAAMVVWQSRMMGTTQGYQVEIKGKQVREALEKAIK